MIPKGEGFKTSFKRIKETGRLSKLGKRLLLRKTVGITIQLGDHNGSVQSHQEIRSVAFATIGEIVGFKSKVADGETGS